MRSTLAEEFDGYARSFRITPVDDEYYSVAFELLLTSAAARPRHLGRHHLRQGRASFPRRCTMTVS